MDIPYNRLSPEALRGIVEEFVNREGTDYGAVEVPLETKVAQVMDQIRKGLVVIRYDPVTGSCGLFPKE
ncbi:MAG: YheU family protein [Magnetococcales bacterium]|nr:YheU family protein [Magnetococcales bacterium]